MKQKEFPLENVLAVAFDRTLSANKYGVLELCSFLSGTDITPSDIPTIVQDYCRPEILKQHPELNAINISIVTEENYWTWMAEQKWKYGAFITLTAIA
jgi:hypothetical protein